MAAKLTEDEVWRTCPTCGRFVEIVDGKWSQHTDPKSWGGRQKPRQCDNAGRSALSQHQGGTDEA